LRDLPLDWLETGWALWQAEQRAEAQARDAASKKSGK
jgi:hypothetical protein